MNSQRLPDNSMDHVVLATPDVAETSAWIEQATGVTASYGGAHVGRGTFNRLCSFGNGVYLEIIGPDPDQPHPVEPRPFGIDSLRDAGVAAWCVRRSELAALAARGSEFDAAFVGPVAMSRDAPEGLLSWQLLFVSADVEFGLIPFFIDWGDSPHPSWVASPGLELVGLRAGHPDPQRVLRLLLALDLTLEVTEGDRPGLTIDIVGPRGPLCVRPAAYDT